MREKQKNIQERTTNHTIMVIIGNRGRMEVDMTKMLGYSQLKTN